MRHHLLETYTGQQPRYRWICLAVFRDRVTVMITARGRYWAIRCADLLKANSRFTLSEFSSSKRDSHSIVLLTSALKIHDFLPPHKRPTRCPRRSSNRCDIPSIAPFSPPVYSTFTCYSITVQTIETFQANSYRPECVRTTISEA